MIFINDLHKGIIELFKFLNGKFFLYKEYEKYFIPVYFLNKILKLFAFDDEFCNFAVENNLIEYFTENLLLSPYFQLNNLLFEDKEIYYGNEIISEIEIYFNWITILNEILYEQKKFFNNSIYNEIIKKLKYIKENSLIQENIDLFIQLSKILVYFYDEEKENYKIFPNEISQIILNEIHSFCQKEQVENLNQNEKSFILKSLKFIRYILNIDENSLWFFQQRQFFLNLLKNLPNDLRTSVFHCISLSTTCEVLQNFNSDDTFFNDILDFSVSFNHCPLSNEIWEFLSWVYVTLFKLNITIYKQNLEKEIPDGKNQKYSGKKKNTVLIDSNNSQCLFTLSKITSYDKEKWLNSKYDFLIFLNYFWIESDKNSYSNNFFSKLSKNLSILFKNLYDFFMFNEKSFLTILFSLTSICISLLEFVPNLSTYFVEEGSVYFILNRILLDNTFSNNNLIGSLKEEDLFFPNQIEYVSLFFILILNVIIIQPDSINYMIKNNLEKIIMEKYNYIENFRNDDTETFALKLMLFSIQIRIYKETEEKQLKLDEKIFETHFDILKSHLGLEGKQYPYDLQNFELLDIFNIFCKNIKNESYHLKIIPFLLKYFQQNFNDDIQQMAAECLFSLSFYEHCKKIMNMNENIEILKNINKKYLKTNKTVQNILWNINRNNENLLKIDKKIKIIKIEKILIHGCFENKIQLKILQEVINKLKNSFSSFIFYDVFILNENSSIQHFCDQVDNFSHAVLCFSKKFKFSNLCKLSKYFFFKFIV